MAIKMLLTADQILLVDITSLRQSKKTYGNVELLMWEKSSPKGGSRIQLVVRLNGGAEPWLSAQGQWKLCLEASSIK